MILQVLRHVTRTILSRKICFTDAVSSDPIQVKECMNNTRWIRTSCVKHTLILGIETSCDDTGAAVVNDEGKIIGEAIHSQLPTHLKLGGIIPPVARDLHAANIDHVVNTALQNAGLRPAKIDIVAVTIKPGLPLSLVVGRDYAREFCKKWNKPLIPIHHMEAHALTARMVHKVEFPFLVLLVSGGHCLLAVVKGVDEFLLVGESIDKAPGEALDKAARRLKLTNIPEFSAMSGGRAIESLAQRGNVRAFEFPHPMSHYKDCSFSFSGLEHNLLRHVIKEERKYDIEADGVIPTVTDLCAGFQHAIMSHICRKLQRGMLYADTTNLIPKEARRLVVSGGVACNQYLRDCLAVLCRDMEYELFCPPPKLCTDNGIMIAWNGMERWKAGVGIAHDLDTVNIMGKCPLGTNISEDVLKYNIRCDWVRLLPRLSSPLAPHPKSLLVN